MRKFRAVHNTNVLTRGIYLNTPGGSEAGFAYRHPDRLSVYIPACQIHHRRSQFSTERAYSNFDPSPQRRRVLSGLSTRKLRHCCTIGVYTVACRVRLLHMVHSRRRLNMAITCTYADVTNGLHGSSFRDPDTYDELQIFLSTLFFVLIRARASRTQYTRNYQSTLVAKNTFIGGSQCVILLTKTRKHAMHSTSIGA